MLNGLHDQVIEVLLLLSIVVDDLREAVAEIVVVEGKVELILTRQMGKNPGRSSR